MFYIPLKLEPAVQDQLNRIEIMLQSLDGKLNGISTKLATLDERLTPMALDLSRLSAEIAENNSAITSAVTLINQIAQELRDAAGNQDAVNALADQLDAQSNNLAAAVVANTPAAPEPAPEA